MNEEISHDPGPSDKTVRIDHNSKTITETDTLWHNSEDKVTLRDLKKILEDEKSNTLDRFSNLEEIGTGGTGTVIQGFEAALGRNIAIKTLNPAFRDKKKAVERFIREARATAQIEHPNIVPIHELGIMDDVGLFFTMKKVRGVTLKKILEDLEDGDETALKEYSLNSLLEIFLKACQGVAFAHSRGIIHRDLKPENIMVGDFGEALVMDWGLVKNLNDSEEDVEDIKLNLNEDVALTIDGTISGTPLFMAPEQAMGKNSEVNKRTDIYGLGTILYSILTFEPAPFDPDFSSCADLLQAVSKGAFEPPGKHAPERKIPKELDAICMKAMATNPEDRYCSVKELISDIRAYRDGYSVSAYKDPLFTRFKKMCFRHSVMSSVIAVAIFVALGYFTVSMTYLFVKYKLTVEAADEYKAKGNKDLKNAQRIYSDLEKVKASIILKEKTEKEMRLEKLLSEADADAENNYSTALMLYSRVPEFLQQSARIKSGVKEIMTNRIDYSLLTKDYAKTQKWIDLLRLWYGDNFEKLREEKNIKELEDIEKNVNLESVVRINSVPEGAHLTLYKIKENRFGVLNETSAQDLGKTPINRLSFPQGSYLLKVTTDSGIRFNYPFLAEHGNSLDLNIIIPESIPKGMVYIPAGDFYCGGEESREVRLHKCFVAGFFIKEFEVTFGEYIKFWKELKSANLKRKYMSKVRLNREIRAFSNAWDKNGNLIKALNKECPLVGITEEAANAYCEWLGKKTGKEIRLPSCLQWEKAARGVDARDYVWGNEYQNGFAFTLENTEARKKYGRWAKPGQFPKDVSVYGVYDTAGNVREYTRSKFLTGGPFFQVKGASSSLTKRFLFCASSSDTPVVPSDIGFRYVMPFRQKQEKINKGEKNGN
jgi:serine/threonine-protein kinase